MHAGRGARRYSRSSPRAISQGDFYFDRWIAARIKNFQCRDAFDDSVHFVLRMLVSVFHKPHVCGLKIFYKYNSLSLTCLLWIQRFTRRLKRTLVTKKGKG